MSDRSRRRMNEQPNDFGRAPLRGSKSGITQSRLHGLYNQGATCYLNSVLQVLFMTTEIHDRLDLQQQTDLQLKTIFEGLKQNECETKAITREFGIKNVHEQQDAAESLENILRKVSPAASKVFRGQLQYTTTCSKGHIIIKETNPFWTLPLSLKDTNDRAYSVKDGLAMFFQTKQFRGDDQAYCNTCNKKREAESRCEMVRCPHILTLLLKRFDFDYSIMAHVKSDCCVDVPLTLQIKNKEYSLYGAVNHIGSLRGGHYTATVLSSEDKTWYEFDDTHVEKVKQQPSAKSEIYKSSTAYLLMYREHEIDHETNSEHKRHQDKTSHSKMHLGTAEDVEAQHKSKETDASAPLNYSPNLNQSKKRKKKGEDSQQTRKSSSGKRCTKDFLVLNILLVSILCLMIIALVIFLKSV